MKDRNEDVRVGGVWLTVASFLMIVALAFHGPISPDLDVQMTRTARDESRWAVVHWIAAAGLSLYAVAGLVVLNSRSRLNDGLWALAAWAVVTVGALWIVTTAIAETTVVARAAATGSRETFQAWWAFAEGNGNGFALLALAVAVIAGNEAGASTAATPSWSACFATAAGISSFAGWALGMWFGIPFGNVLWLIASVVMTMWTLWFGIALMRLQAQPGEVQHQSHRLRRDSWRFRTSG